MTRFKLIRIIFCSLLSLPAGTLCHAQDTKDGQDFSALWNQMDQSKKLLDGKNADCTLENTTGSANFSPDICDHPYATICPPANDTDSKKSALLKKAQIKSNIKREALVRFQQPIAQGGCGFNPSRSLMESSFRIQGESDAAYRDRLAEQALMDPGQSHLSDCYFRALNDSLDKRLKKSGLSLQMLEQQFQNIQKNLLSTIENQSTLDPAIRKSMANDIRKTYLMTSENALRSMKEKGAAFRGFFFDVCGPDLLSKNAFASMPFRQGDIQFAPDHTSGSRRIILLDRAPVVICPGHLIEWLDGSGTDPLMNTVAILGHELGHQIHAIKNWSLTPFEKNERALVPLPNPKNPGKPLLRIQEIPIRSSYYNSDGTPLNPALTHINYTPAFSKYMQCLEKNYSDRLSTDGPELHNDSTYKNDIIKSLGIEGRELNGAESHCAELSADYWSAEVLSRWVTHATHGDRAKVAQQVSTSLRRICTAQGKEDYDPGVHPPARLRMELILKNPGLRKALGCKALEPTDKPYCTLQGDSR